ncbi:MAG: NAD-dependent epimerase/dehydratase family protein [Candidatus Thorarchaeota archaeon]|jgi:UDP-glucose 4-epimerase
MKTILVTGCAGFIASHITEQLLKNECRVFGVDNLHTGVMENMSTFISDKNFRFIKSDINNPDLDSLISEDIDTVYHLAAISSVKQSTENPKLVNHVNVNGTISILEFARKRNTRTVVYSGSAAVYGDPEILPISEKQLLEPLSPYGASKIAAESYVHAYGKTYGINTMVLRYFNVYGPRQDSSEYSGVIAIFADKASNGQPLIIEGDGQHTRSFLYVEDVVKVTITAGNTPNAAGSTINVSGPDSISILKLAEIIQKTASSNSIEIRHGPPRIGDIKDSIGTTELARKLLDFSPSTTLEEGLQMTLDWYQESK